MLAIEQRVWVERKGGRGLAMSGLAQASMMCAS